ncbi:MAG: hypothetical protein IPH45_08385 [Bacteroidales bacterium]|nr:hypothetical protein [Bacteroidales bacterium]
MKEMLTRFAKNLAIISLLISITAAGLAYFLPALYSPALPWLILLFIFSTSFLYYILLKASTGKFNRFTNIFMAASVIKLLLLLVLITFYLYFFKTDAIRFVISIFVLYIVYTLLEVIWLLKISKMGNTAGKS